MKKITNFATNIFIDLVSSIMKAKPDYPYDIYNLSNPEIFLDDIILYEQGKCKSLSNFEVDFSDSLCLNESQLIFLLDIVVNLSVSSENEIIYSDQDYFTRNLILQSRAKSTLDLLSLGFTIKHNKIYNFSHSNPITNYNQYYDFLFALRLRQYHFAPEYLDKFLKHHYDSYFKSSVQDYLTFLKDILSNEFKQLVPQVLVTIIIKNMDELLFTKQLKDLGQDRFAWKVNPKNITKAKIKAYFMKLNRPYNNSPILTEADIDLFLSANFVGFSFDDSRDRKKNKY